MIDLTGCDGVMVARGAKGNPWLLGVSTIISILEFFASPDREELKRQLSATADQLQTEFRANIAMREMRGHVAWYTAGYPNSSSLRNDINKVASMEELIT